MIINNILISFWSFLMLAVSIVTTTDIQAQNMSNDIISSFTAYRNTHYPEKIYVHSARELYLTGETIWFKIYCVDGTLHQTSTLSKVVYIELIKDSIESVMHTAVHLQNGSGSGSFYLPTTLNSGNYTLRAYTNWMRNNDEAFFFHHTLTVINPFKRLELPDQKYSSSYSLTFFPEGGTLIANHESKVAFKGTDINGRSIAFKGWLTDHAGNKVLNFRSLHTGMGSFVFIPQINESYHGHIIGPDSLQYDFSFPNIQPKGLSISVKLNEIRIEATNSHKINQTAKLFVHTRGMIKTVKTLDLRYGKATVTIDKQKLEPGITHITLFDENGHPACERLIFIQPKSLLNIQIEPDQKLYKTREHINLRINASITGETTMSNLSVSVYKYDKHLPKNGDNIVSNLLLSSDLKGHIENPEYYFNEQYNVTEALDNLMLIHGWRRFAWDDIRQSPDGDIIKIPDYRGMILSGTLRNKKTGNPVKDTLVYLSSPGKYLQTYNSKSDSLGRVWFELRNFYGKHQIVIQTQYKPKDGYDLKMDPLYSNKKNQYPPSSPVIKSDCESVIKQLSVSMQVKNAYINSIDQALLPPSDTSLFYGTPEERYKLDDYTRFKVMEEVMREYIHGVLVRKRQGHFHFRIIDSENKQAFVNDPFILIDGVPVFQTDRIMNYDPRNVERIDVITRKYFIGNKVCQGIVNYTTYSGDLHNFDISDADLVMFLNGLQKKRIFYSPRYENASDLESRTPDMRNLLHWQPEVTTDENGTAIVDFYSSDETGIYKIVVEGITPQGIPGYEEFFIEIKNSEN